jgi:hypothetical protein
MPNMPYTKEKKGGGELWTQTAQVLILSCHLLPTETGTSCSPSLNCEQNKAASLHWLSLCTSGVVVG